MAGLHCRLPVVINVSGRLSALPRNQYRDAPGTQGDIAAMPEAVWVRAEGRFLRRIDPETLDVVEELSAPEASGGAVLEAYGSLWATAYNDNVMYRLTPQ